MLRALDLLGHLSRPAGNLPSDSDSDLSDPPALPSASAYLTPPNSQTDRTKPPQHADDPTKPPEPARRSSKRVSLRSVPGIAEAKSRAASSTTPNTTFPPTPISTTKPTRGRSKQKHLPEDVTTNPDPHDLSLTTPKKSKKRKIEPPIVPKTGASGKILLLQGKYIPPHPLVRSSSFSSLKCIETVRDDPWKILVATCLLNVTSGRAARPIYNELLLRYPDPKSMSKGKSLPSLYFAFQS
jgi:hypothetical protein